jgi:hypothetical protein
MTHATNKLLGPQLSLVSEHNSGRSRDLDMIQRILAWFTTFLLDLRLATGKWACMAS